MQVAAQHQVDPGVVEHRQEMLLTSSGPCHVLLTGGTCMIATLNGAVRNARSRRFPSARPPDRRGSGRSRTARNIRCRCRACLLRRPSRRKYGPLAECVIRFAGRGGEVVEVMIREQARVSWLPRANRNGISAANSSVERRRKPSISCCSLPHVVDHVAVEKTKSRCSF